MLNIQKSKNTVLISNISIITVLNFAFYTRAASLLASRGLEAVLHEAEVKTHEAEDRTHFSEAKTHEAEARTHEAEAKTHEARFFGLEAKAKQALRLNITDVYTVPTFILFTLYLHLFYVYTVPTFTVFTRLLSTFTFIDWLSGCIWRVTKIMSSI